MKKQLLLFSMVASLFLLTSVDTSAQFSAQVLGNRFIVESPASIAGVKDFTFASDPSGTGPWGGSISGIVHQEVVKAVDSEACGTINPNVAGKWALVYRGNCEFGLKAYNAQQAGATGVIIWNHTPNELINMAAGTYGASVTIPVVFISNADGREMTNQLSNGQQVFISTTLWGFGYSHDLAFVPGSAAAPPGFALPLNQFNGTNTPAYRGYVAAALANTGLSTETNVKVVGTTEFTPAGGGTPAMVHTDTISIAAYTPADSVVIASSPNGYAINPTQRGTYNVEYTLSADDPDQYPFDNTLSYSFQITNDAFCRVPYDEATQTPVATGYSRVNNNSDWTWGPLFYNEVGGYQLKALRLAIADDDTSKHSLFNNSAGQSYLEAYIYKWNDANGNGVMEANELDMAGRAIRTFDITDSPKKVMTLDIGDPADGSPKVIVSENNTYYWVAVSLGSQFRIGANYNYNYYTRAFASTHATSPAPDFWAPAINKSKDDFGSNDTIKLIAYGVLPSYSNQIDSADYTQQTAIPAVAMITSLYPASTGPSVSNVSSSLNIFPNPAKDVVSIDIALQSEQKVTLRIIDVLGKEVYQSDLGRIKEKRIPYNVKNLAPGNYYAVVIMDNGKKMVKPIHVVR